MHVRKVLKALGILLNGKKTAKSIANSGNDQLPSWRQVRPTKKVKIVRERLEEVKRYGKYLRSNAPSQGR